MREANALDEAVDLVAHLPEPRAVEQQRQGDVLLDAQAGEQVEELEDEAQLAAPEERNLVVRQDADAGAIDEYLAARHAIETADQVQQRALTRAAGPSDHAELPRRQLEVNAVQGPHLLASLSKDFCDLLDPDHGILLRHPPRVSGPPGSSPRRR